MSSNIHQVFLINPITSNAAGDLMYFGQSPYGAANDAAMTYANFAAQFLTTASLPLSLANGGTGASLVASNGGIFYSTSTSAAILPGNATVNHVLLSGAMAAPTWSSATYPSNTTVNQLLYSSATNTISGLPTAINGTFVTSNTGVPSILAGPGTTGNILQSNAAAAPSFSTATYPSTTTINQILYSSATDTVTGLPTNNNGTLVTNSTGIPSILAGPGTTGNILQSNAAAAPSFSTATYPSTTTVNQLLYSSATNVVSGLASVVRSSLTTNSTGVPTWIALTNGQIVIGSTAGSPAAATLTAGTGVSITNGSNSITIASSGADLWVDQTTTTVTMTANTGYTSNAGASLITFTLPTTSAVGDFIEINGKGAGLWRIAQAAGQQINFGSAPTTLGAGGSLTSTLQFDCIKIRCITANTIWVVVSVQGNITVV